MSESTHCYKCAELMSHADHRDESIEGDSLCIACRTAAETDREEEAVASFCDRMKVPVADWFSGIIDKSGFEFTRRLPADTNEAATALFYTHGPLQMQCHGALPRVMLTKPCAGFPTQPDWVIEFHCPTPERIVLATINAAMSR